MYITCCSFGTKRLLQGTKLHQLFEVSLVLEGAKICQIPQVSTTQQRFTGDRIWSSMWTKSTGKCDDKQAMKLAYYIQICLNSHLPLTYASYAANLFLTLCDIFPIETISPKRPIIFGTEGDSLRQI
jgi:hypothetical protein